MVLQWMKAGRYLAIRVLSLGFALACAASANGQVSVGDKLSMSMNGSLGIGYAGNTGNYFGSSHSLGFGIDGFLKGYYFHPQFLNFNVHPYYDRAQSNAASQIITRSSGVGSELNLFSGSRFPGSISYGRDFASNSEFQIAGVPSLLGNSSGSNFGIGWSALLDGLPAVHATYTIANSTSTLLDTTSQSRSSSKIFNLNSSYKLGGFYLNGNLSHFNGDFLSPSFLTGGDISRATSSTNYSVVANHRLPLTGNLTLRWSRTTSKYGDKEFTDTDFTSDSYAATTSFVPWQRLSLAANVNYTTNVTAAFAQSLDISTISPLDIRESDSDAVYMNASGVFRVGHGLSVTGHLNHRVQHYLGRSLTQTQYGGSLNFRRTDRFLGFLSASVGLIDTVTKQGNTGLGLVASLNVNHRFRLWETSADFIYSQFSQTLYTIQTTSNYSFGGSLRRKLNSDTYWISSFRESRSGLTAQQGSDNVSDTVGTNLSWRRFSVSGNYSRSKGEALLAADGTLTPTPLGSIIGYDFLTFNARSYGVFASARFFRKIYMSGGYTNVSSSTIRTSMDAFNNGDRYSARFELRLRKFSIISRFSHAVQEASAVPGGPRTVNSYFITLTRWFNAF